LTEKTAFVGPAEHEFGLALALYEHVQWKIHHHAIVQPILVKDEYSHIVLVGQVVLPCQATFIRQIVLGHGRNGTMGYVNEIPVRVELAVLEVFWQQMILGKVVRHVQGTVGMSLDSRIGIVHDVGIGIAHGVNFGTVRQVDSDLFFGRVCLHAIGRCKCVQRHCSLAVSAGAATRPHRCQANDLKNARCEYNYGKAGRQGESSSLCPLGIRTQNPHVAAAAAATARRLFGTVTHGACQK
jgi:hypothetical protein